MIIDKRGWTIIPEAIDAHVAHVSSSDGNDENTGWYGTPKRTIAAGIALLRDGFPDRLLLKRGDVFHEVIGTLSRRGEGPLSGRSADEPMVFGAYGEGARPLLKIGAEPGIRVWDTAEKSGSHIAIVGLHFYAHTRDPESPDFVGADGGEGLRCISRGENLLIEDCRFDFCGITVDAAENHGGDNPRFANLQIRRSVIYGNYAIGGHAQGLFVSKVDGILLEENVFDHNGWNELAGAKRTMFNHNVYCTSYCTGLRSRGNIIARGSSSGLQARAGGAIEDNLFLSNATQLNFGWLAGGATPVPGGVMGRVSGNVIMDAVPAGDEPNLRAVWGIQLGNIRGAAICDNVLVRSGSINLSGKDYNGWVGINNIAVSNNQVSSATIAIGIVHDGFTDVMVFENLLGGAEGSIHDRDGGRDKISFMNNDERYLPDLLKTIGEYHAMIGRGDTLESYMAEARKQSKQNWRRTYVGTFASKWLRKQAGGGA